MASKTILSKSSTILILSHYYKKAERGGGPPQELRDYLSPKVKTLLYVEHPFPYSEDTKTYISEYERGKLIHKKSIVSFKKFELITYLLDIIKTIYILIIFNKRIDICFALDPLNTFSILFVKKLFKIQKLIFYSIDYTPKRFQNKMLNTLYHICDKYSCYKSDVVWILSKKMLDVRIINRVELKKCAKIIILPMGSNLSRIKHLPLSKINRFNLVFVGHLLEKQGIQLVIQAFPLLLKRYPTIKLIIIGQGEYEKSLKNLVKKLKIKKYIVFKGFIKNHTDVEQLLCKSAIGLAPYQPTKNNYTYFTDPGKPKLYLGCGLPVIITDVPEIAKTIQKHNAGVIIEYSIESVIEKIFFLLDNKNYVLYRNNAILLSKQYDTNTLIKNAIFQSLNEQK